VAILVTPLRFRSQLLSRRHARGELFAFFDPLPGDDQIVDVPAEGLVLRVAEHRCELAVDADDVIVLVEDRDRLRGVLEERGEIDFLRLKRLVETLAVGHIDGDSNRSGDFSVGGAEGLDPCLE
jgi:hypothetical protein